DEADPNANIEALTLRRVANGEDDAEHGLVFAEAFPPLTFLNVIRHRNPAVIDLMNLHSVRRGIYDGQHKLTMVDDRIQSFYDVASDPSEAHDLSVQHVAEAAEMQRKLNSLVTLAESRRAEAGFTAEVDDSVIDHLRALGYIE